MPVVQVRSSRWAGKVGLIVVAALIVVGAGGYLLWRLVPSATQTVRQTDALNEAGQYRAALAKLKSAYGRAFTKSDKALILSRLAATSANADDNEAALRYYQQLDEMEPGNYATLTSLSDLAERLGHKDVALKAYREMADLLGKVSVGPTTATEKDRVDRRIKELQQ